MVTSTHRTRRTHRTHRTRRTRRRRLGACALLLGVGLVLTACGDERPGTDAAAPATRTPTHSNSNSPSASPYVEPGVIDGAPHNGENNAYRRPGPLSVDSAEAARVEAARIQPVLKRLWKARKWDPDSVRTALTGELGYEVRKTNKRGELLGGQLDVQAMNSRYEDGDGNGDGDGDYVTPEGAVIGLYVRDDACVTAFVQKTDYEVSVNGRFMETGCFEPPSGH
ncbi:hypothetical protein AB0H82_35685 [Streptomyces sp. NPDC050732]|uniref:hypothetical protein n=1 Tax=Streptomyces sp. NPDC050732 TaxID=3154632 RepID=UPI0034316D75